MVEVPPPVLVELPRRQRTNLPNPVGYARALLDASAMQSAGCGGPLKSLISRTADWCWDPVETPVDICYRRYQRGRPVSQRRAAPSLDQAYLAPQRRCPAGKEQD
jgi:hypothetical protein